MINLLVMSDIFGICAGFDRLPADLRRAGAEVYIIDPYQGKPQQFANEEDAYAAYTPAKFTNIWRFSRKCQRR